MLPMTPIPYTLWIYGVGFLANIFLILGFRTKFFFRITQKRPGYPPLGSVISWREQRGDKNRF